MALQREGVRSWRQRKEEKKAAEAMPWRKRAQARARVKSEFRARRVAAVEGAQPAIEVRQITPIQVKAVLPQPPRGELFDKRGQVAISIADLMEDTISVIRNSKLTFEQIRAKGGPCPATLVKWLSRETTRPQLNTLRAALVACGADFYITVRKPSA